MHVRGVRGAVTAEANTEQAILDATRTLLAEMARANDVEPHEIAAIVFTATPDLTAAFPAEAARQLGWLSVPLMSGVEIDVPGALPRCIRVLMLWNTPRAPEEVVHVYLGDATRLRPDLAASARGADGDPSRDQARGSHRGQEIFRVPPG
ncbi:MAG: chorismate mutase [Armatimonadota bacterium]|nr:chorismate mutase [Armatimonadota bacterium]MDR7531903.1 chorismate mutase [Armatimonadota bacterium]MDR7534752.1 chorismate mutase [Armatimonadota bacterium]